MRVIQHARPKRCGGRQLPHAFSIRIDSSSDLAGGDPIVPDLGKYILANIEPHSLRDRPLAQSKTWLGGAIVCYRLGIGCVLAAIEDIPNSALKARINEEVGKVTPIEVKIILHRPPHANIFKSVVAVTQDRLYFGPVIRTSHYNRGIAN